MGFSDQIGCNKSFQQVFVFILTESKNAAKQQCEIHIPVGYLTLKGMLVFSY